MKTFLLSFFLLVTVSLLQAQTNPQKPKRNIFHDSTVVRDDEIVYPIKGSFLVSETGFIMYKKVEFWIHDAEGKEIYYSNHAMQTGITDPEEFSVKMDREYAKLMRKYGMRMTRNQDSQN